MFRRKLSLASALASQVTRSWFGASNACPSFARQFLQSPGLYDTPATSFASGTSGGTHGSGSAWRKPLGATLVGTSAAAAMSSGYSSSAEAANKEAPPPTHAVLGKVVLYQYAVCPFCNKVRAYLDYHNIPYHVVEVNPLFKNELKFSEYKKVPVLMVDGEQMNDSSVIVEQLTAKLDAAKPKKSPGFFGGGKKQAKEAADAAAEEAKWCSWVDSKLVHVLTPNLYRTPGEAWQAFDYITQTGNFNFFEKHAARVSGAVMMYVISKMVLKKRHCIEEERPALYLAVQEWIKAVGDRNFLGGKEPNSADLSVFGVIRAVRGMDTWSDVMADTSIGPWYERMEKAVAGSAMIAEEAQGY